MVVIFKQIEMIIWLIGHCGVSCYYRGQAPPMTTMITQYIRIVVFKILLGSEVQQLLLYLNKTKKKFKLNDLYIKYFLISTSQSLYKWATYKNYHVLIDIDKLKVFWAFETSGVSKKINK